MQGKRHKHSILLISRPRLFLSAASEELRSMQARQRRAVARGRYYFAITPHDRPFTMLQVLPASKTSKLSAIHEVPHHSINVDLIWDH